MPTWRDTTNARFQRFVAYRVARATIRQFRRSMCTQHAAEIAFYSIVALIPFTALLIFVLATVSQSVVGPEWTHHEVALVIERLLAELMPGSQPATVTEGVAESLIEDQTALGTFGLTLMLITASLAFGAVNRALSSVFQVPRRGIMTSIFLFSVLLSGVGLIVFLALSMVVATQTGQGDTGHLSQSVAQHLGLVRFGAPAILFVGFVYLLRVVLRVAVSWKAIVSGGLCFVVCFEVARFGYAFYLSNIAQLNVIYGSLAGTMGTVFWFYYVAFVFLSSLCLVRVIDERLYDAK